MDSSFQYDPYQLHLRKGKYYASVAVPLAIRHLFSDTRVRKSTGLSDRKEASKRAIQVQVPAIHRELNLAFTKLDPFIEGLRPILTREGVDVSTWYTRGTISITVYGDRTQMGKSGIAAFIDGQATTPVEKWSADDYVKVAGIVSGLGYSVPNKLLELLPDEQRVLIHKASEPKTMSPNVVRQLVNDYPNQYEGENSLGTKLLDKYSKAYSTVTLETQTLTTPLFSQLVDGYLTQKLKETPDRKTHGKRVLACKRIIEVIGDMPVTKYDKVHAIEVARFMQDSGASNALIKDTISYGRGLFKYAGTIRNELKEVVLPVQPWTDISLKDFGTPTRSYKPLTEEELLQLFAQEMGTDERLILSILVTTGMRLDEVALITWERITTFEDILCFSLISDVEDVKVKNISSKRYIPVPNIIKPLLGNGGQGRLFPYRLDKSGKAENSASKALMPLIRNVTSDDRKVVHSLRGNFKDFVRDIGVSKETNDFLTGHGQGDVAGRRYGQGPSMQVRLNVIDQIKHPWLNQPN